MNEFGRREKGPYNTNHDRSIAVYPAHDGRSLGRLDEAKMKESGERHEP